MRKLAFALVGLLSALPAFAKVVTYEYTGVVSMITESTPARMREVGRSTGIPGALAIGDTFHGSFSYDTAAPMTPWTGSTEWASYYSWMSTAQAQAPATSLVVDHSGTTIAGTASAPSLAINKTASSTYFSITPDTDYSVSPNGSLSFRFYDDRASNSPGLTPLKSLDLDDFYSAAASFTWNNPNKLMMAEGLITSLNNVTAVSPVPEPDSYAMVLVALGAIGGLARRQRRASAK